jgi:hypothetical protein
MASIGAAPIARSSRDPLGCVKRLTSPSHASHAIYAERAPTRQAAPAEGEASMKADLLTGIELENDIQFQSAQPTDPLPECWILKAQEL